VRSGRLLLALVIAGSALVGTAAPADASCGPSWRVPKAMREADLVFVGTVEKLTNADRWATFTIEDLWKGSPDGRSVEIHAGPKGENAHSSIDRTYELGTRYLVLAYEPGAHGSADLFDSRFQDNRCSRTQPYLSTLKRFRPDTAPTRPPAVVATDSTADSGLGPVVLAGGLISVAALVAWPLSRRRSRRSEA